MNDEEDADSSDSEKYNSDADGDTEGDELDAAGEWNAVGKEVSDLKA